MKTNIAVIVPSMVAPFRFSDISDFLIIDGDGGKPQICFNFTPIPGVTSQVKLEFLGYILEYDNRPEEEIASEFMDAQMDDNVKIN